MSLANLDHLVNPRIKNANPSKLKGLFKYRTPDCAYLGGGLPLPEYFAWESIGATTRRPPFEDGLSGTATKETELSFQVCLNPSENGSESNLDIPLKTSLQYGAGRGPAALVEFLTKHTDMIHKVPYKDWGLITTVGSTQGWDAILTVFTQPDDLILVERYCFTSALQTATNKGCIPVPVDMDAHGIIPEKLEAKLKTLSKIPKLLYTVPTGQNPTGSSLSIERRKAIYEIASRYNFIIVEDEPYYFLQSGEYVRPEERSVKTEKPTNEEFLNSLVPSFLSLDVEGRVIRLDSFSKIVAPGSRIGWIVAQENLIQYFQRVNDTSVQQPSGFASSLVYGTLARWGHDGYIDWLKVLGEEYTYKRNIAIDCALKYLPKEYVTVNPPVAGMFFTMSFDATKHPQFKSEYNSDPIALETAIFEKSAEKKAILVPGSWFSVLEEDETPSNEFFFRGTYAATDAATLETGIKRFGEAIREIYHM